MVAAGVPSRIEYWKVKAFANRDVAAMSNVAWKSSSVSPGKPTMMSVEIAAMPDAAHRPEHPVRP